VSDLTYQEFRRQFDRLSKRRQAWVRAKAQWEHMTLWAVMRDWDVPASANLRPDGTWNPGAPAARREGER